MARENNFLIGQGEKLTSPVQVPTGGSPKNMPYDFPTTRKRLSENLISANDYFRSLPPETCPRDQSVAIITMHPRFVSKSDFPTALLNSVGLKPLGSRQKAIAPELWGISKHPEVAQTEQIFVAAKRDIFYHMSDLFTTWNATIPAAQSLLRIESISAFTADSKIKSIPDNQQVVLLEVLIHNANDPQVITTFMNYVSKLKATAIVQKRRDLEGLTFIPVEVSRDAVLDLAKYSFVRVCRGMPALRPVYPALIRDSSIFSVKLPKEDPIDSETKAVIFDGGIPRTILPSLSQWVSLIEPSGIGPVVPDWEAHGLAVTGAFLFGSLSRRATASPPVCRLDHVRVLDQKDASSPDLEYVNVIDRIASYLDTHRNQYRLVNLSIGPNIPIEDDDISYWTLALDQRFALGHSVVTIAAGNAGERDSASGLNRIQPPADAINVLSVGATDCADSSSTLWNRAPYSSVGPGRAPGLVKPDGLAFGGCATQPFYVLNSASQAVPVWGTSFSSPLSLRSAAAIAVQFGNRIQPLTVRALMIHQAEDEGQDRSEVGWGRFVLDPEQLITCPDNSPTIIYQGELPIGTHLRASIPLPVENIDGFVTITATILISPETSPGFTGAYTESGFMAFFRPHSRKFTEYPDGTTSIYPRTVPFFSEGSMYGVGEYELREGGLKWEPCVKRSRRFRGISLDKPCFDIYYHHREDGLPAKRVHPIQYALLVTIHAPRLPDLYDRIIRAYAGILVPIRPRIRVRIAT